MITAFDEGCNYREVEYKFRIYYIYKSDYRRFHEKYIINEETGCWEWTASLMGHGYAFFRLFNNIQIYGHIASFLMFKDKRIKLDHYICHSCDIKHCVNPEHLWLGSSSDNSKDSFKKGRRVNNQGEFNGNAILTEEIVKEIRSMKANNISNVKIYEKFSNYNKQTIKSAIYVNWKHIN